MARDMTPAERRAFLTEGTRTGKVAVARHDGAPHVVPVWFVLDGDEIVFTTGVGTVKGKSIVRDGRIAVCVDDEHPPYGFVMIEGTARTSDDLAELLGWATKIGSRYMGADRAVEFGERNAVPGELLVRVTPTRIVAVADMTG
jgi:PPOX class probable F420-dependent enzyme